MNKNKVSGLAEHFDRNHARKVLKSLLTTPSPTGMTAPVTRLIDQLFRECGFVCRHTNKGALVAAPNPDWLEECHTIFASHADTLGGMVRKLKKRGRVELEKIGGFPFRTVAGEYVTLHSHGGHEYTGTILPVKASGHAYKDEDDSPTDKHEDFEVRLDMDAETEKDLENGGIRVGDFISLDPRFRMTSSDWICSRHLDNKAGVAALLCAARAISRNPEMYLDGCLPFCFLVSTHEEVGHGASPSICRGAREMVVVDMAVVADGRCGDEKCVSICAKDSSGPYDLGLRKFLVRIAEEKNICHKVDIYPYYGSDGSAALRAGQDIRVALIGPGVDASHSNERTHLDGIMETCSLILGYTLERPLRTPEGADFNMPEPESSL
ncbi:MAG: hypothetical protein CVV64_19635 [Candidatus Wallbacteria bacterium HGW-Wallbacteria-1]|uniref:Peptidase M42 n=1 Tax=Candidatus Wallbacteria bacterium HGW-Wallbacteria-1 TaxID=2013854 RepID=A0A2N1PIS7_9BACT|nr:MAG: hypothetical protein CVV64_19635 [Candidatus Wallbacteria bacterium HGW-Wallbacteria-1]